MPDDDTIPWEQAEQELAWEKARQELVLAYARGVLAKDAPEPEDEARFAELWESWQQ